MSSLIGTPADRWPLARAVDALGEAARQGGRPGMVWIAGVLYPSLGVGAGAGWDYLPGLWFEVSGASRTGDPLRAVLGSYLPLLLMPFAAILVLPVFRLVAGLARTASAEAWSAAAGARRSPGLRALWAAGRGLTLGTYGLWLQLVLMQLGAVLVLLAPIVLAARPLLDAASEERMGTTLALGVLISPVILLLGAYMLALSVLGQLGLQSLAHNQRGVSSALLHGWRIMRHDPWATARAVAADVVLLLFTLLAVRLFDGLIGGLPLTGWLTGAFQLLLAGFAGVVRAGYWARAYRALGGLAPGDGIPGLTRN